MRASDQVEHAKVLMMQAEFARGADRRDLLDEATDTLLRAEKSEPGIGAWELACIHARQGNLTLCGRWLERGHTHNLLPARDEILASPYFAEARVQAWVRDFFDER